MYEDPSSFFGGLSRGCIRDEYLEEPKVVRECVLLMILGLGSSVLTAYALSLLGILV
jgi:hypothetical protein